MLSKPVKITIAVSVAAVAVLGAFDVAMVVLFGKDATISVVITRFSHDWPAIPFAFGFLMGHFFGQNTSR